MVTNSDVKKLSDTISTLQQDMAQVGTLVDRLDVTIEKLTEVSTRVSELLAVQGTRLLNQEKVSEQIQTLIETRRVETDTNIKDVYVRVERVEKDLYSEIDASQKTVLTQIKEMDVDLHWCYCSYFLYYSSWYQVRTIKQLPLSLDGL